MKTFSFQTHFQNGNAFIYKSFAKRKCFWNESKWFSKRNSFYLWIIWNLKNVCIFFFLLKRCQKKENFMVARTGHHSQMFFQHFESVFLNTIQFLPNDYIIVFMWCLFRCYLRAKVPQLQRSCSEAISKWATKLPGKFAKHRICWWCSSGVCEWVVSCLLYMLKKQYESCENGLKDFLHVSIILISFSFWNKILANFLSSNI